MAQPLESRGLSAILLMVVVLVVGALGFGGWWVWKKSQDHASKNQAKPATNTTSKNDRTTEVKQDPYEGWKTYINEPYGISFRYPSDWNIKEFKPDENTSSAAITVGFAVYIKRNEEVKYNTVISIEELSRDLDGMTRWYDSPMLVKTTQNLKGKPSVQYSQTDGNEPRLKKYLFGVNAKTYEFSSINEMSNVEKDPDYWSKFDKVFDSFEIK
jgi:hypothetical protein